MSKFANLIASIKAAIKTNGAQGITGQILQNKLLEMVSELGAGFTFGGVITPESSFDSATYGDVNVVFLASVAGSYPTFGGFTLQPGQVALFSYDGAWKKSIISYYANEYVYGIRHYFTNSSPDLTRIGDASLHQELPVQSLMRRCVVDDLGVVKYYLKADDSTKKEDGTSAVLDGTDGQVMVEIPAHYRKCTLNSAQSYMDVEISLYPFEGAVPRPRRLVSAYEATIDRSGDTLKLASVVNNTAAFRGGNNTADWDETYRDLRGLPATNVSLTNFRTYGRNRGSKWGCYDYNAHLDIYWLFCIEYATLDSQKTFNPALTAEGYHQGGLGAGVSNINSTSWSNYNGYNPFIPCGFTNSLGNATGVKTWEMSEAQAEAYGSEFSTSVPSYRGIENPFGHIWKWTDGFLGVGNGEYQEVYVCRDPEKYSSSVTADYTDMGHEASANGYCKYIYASDSAIDQAKRVYGDIFDRDDSGSASTFFCDYHYHANTADTTYGLQVGGVAGSGSYVGLASLNAISAPSYAGASVGSRLCWSE